MREFTPAESEIQGAVSSGLPRLWRGGWRESWHGLESCDPVQSHHARGARDISSARKRFAQRLELLHTLKLLRRKGQMGRAPQARGGACGRIRPFEFGQNPTAGMDARNEIVIVYGYVLNPKTICMSKPKYFLYARKSTEDDDKQVMSIAAQLFELREHARKENLEILEEFQESNSAKSPGREVINQMTKRLERGEANSELA